MTGSGALEMVSATPLKDAPDMEDSDLLVLLNLPDLQIEGNIGFQSDDVFWLCCSIYL